MKTAVRGPADVKPGDLVEFGDLHKFKQTHYVAEVVKANPKKLMVRVVDGDRATVSHPYSYEARSGGFAGRMYTAYRFNLLDAHDRWMRECPATKVASVVEDKSIIFAFHEIERAPVVAVEELQAIIAWLARKPAKGAP